MSHFTCSHMISLLKKKNHITNKWVIIKLYNLNDLKGWNGVRNLHIISPHAFLSPQIIMLSVFSYFRGLQISGYSPTAIARTPASTLSWQVKTETGGNLKSERKKSWWKKLLDNRSEQILYLQVPITKIKSHDCHLADSWHEWICTHICSHSYILWFIENLVQ